MLPAWDEFPDRTTSTADTALMNQRLQGYIDAMPEQYYWVHKRFKTAGRGSRASMRAGVLKERGRAARATKSGLLVDDPVRGALAPSPA